MDKEELQYNNFQRLKEIVNRQIDVNNLSSELSSELIEEGDVYSSDYLLPSVLVSLGIIDYYQHKQLVYALDTNNKLY